MIGDSIRVIVVGVGGRQVRLGIEAPGQIGVHREEVYKRIQEENRKAAQGGPEVLRRVAEIWRQKR